MSSTRNASVAGRRRLTARSVLASTLLGVAPPQLPTRALVSTAELFGIAPGTTRVALSRMVAAGELEPVAAGYRLVGPLLARQARQEQSRSGATGPWDGRWRTLVVVGEARPAAERARLRSALEALRLAELREGVWLRPANLVADVLPEAEALAAASTLDLDSTVDDGPALAARLWDLDGWADVARATVGELDRLGADLDAGRTEALADAFVASADALRHLQADPLLPAPLLPAAWPGDDLRARHRAYDASFKALLTTWARARP